MDNNQFTAKNAEEKIEELIYRIKTTIMSGGKISPVFYLFDQNDKLHVIQIKDKFLLKKDRKSILNRIIKEKIDELKVKNSTIEKILFLREGFYSKSHPDKQNMNLDTDFNKENSNEALIATIEDVFNFEIKVFDMIKIYESGVPFTVLSEEPIEYLQLCKIDPECNIITNHINLI